MKFNELIANHLAGTALSPTLVKHYLKTPPHYHQWGVEQRLDSYVLNQLKATDLFEFYLREYLTGRHRTLRAVLREVSLFTSQDALGAHYLLLYSLTLTRQHLLDLEWYELLPRLDTAQTKVLLLAPVAADSICPSVVESLEASYGLISICK